MGEQEGSGEDSEEGKRNNILQKAILLYIGFVSLNHRSLQIHVYVCLFVARKYGRRRPVPKWTFILFSFCG